jgi:hypothetical protein
MREAVRLKVLTPVEIAAPLASPRLHVDPLQTRHQHAMVGTEGRECVQEALIANLLAQRVWWVPRPWDESVHAVSTWHGRDPGVNEQARRCVRRACLYGGLGVNDLQVRRWGRASLFADWHIS